MFIPCKETERNAKNYFHTTVFRKLYIFLNCALFIIIQLYFTNHLDTSQLTSTLYNILNTVNTELWFYRVSLFIYANEIM